MRSSLAKVMTATGVGTTGEGSGVPVVGPVAGPVVGGAVVGGVVSGGVVSGGAPVRRSGLAAEAVDAVAAVTIAYQPIVSMTSLRAHGFEALTRMPDDHRYSDVISLLDCAEESGELRRVEHRLLTKAITGFAKWSGASDTRLFCNVDNRVFDEDDIVPSAIADLVRKCGLQPANVCIELSERQVPNSPEALARIVDVFLSHNVRLAIDDFGQGYSGLDTLMRVNPHYIKIDRAFVHGVAASPKQQAIIANVVGLAHSLGFLVVGEGVETESDFRALRAAGCDLVQGYLIARPESDIARLRPTYDGVAVRDARTATMPEEIAELLHPVEPLMVTDPLHAAVARFRAQPNCCFIPVTDRHGYVHGAIYQADLSFYLFNEFGPALLANKGLQLGLDTFIRRCPISEAHAPPGALVDSYVVSEGNDGVVITLDGRYQGILRNDAMLRLAAKREVALARDQNPLTLLPGNTSIQHHLGEILGSVQERTVAFFDFDHFKAFNDGYGFAMGDRALQMFAERLLKLRHTHEGFVGHVGGDDFFASLPHGAQESGAIVSAVITDFARDAESLYSPEDRARGGMLGRDRFDFERFFPMLRASAVILPLPAARAHLATSEIVHALAAGKTRAKRSQDGIARVSLPPTQVARTIAGLSEKLAET